MLAVINGKAKKTISLSIVLLFPIAAHATTQDSSSDTPYRFSASYSDLWDSNLLRTPTPISDQVKSIGVSAGYINKFSQQDLALQGSAERQFYSHRDDLNHTDLHGRANWTGNYGNNKFYTQFSSYYDHTLIDQSDLPEKNFLTAYGGKFGAGYFIDKNYSVDLTAGVDSQRNSMDSQKQLDYDDDNLTASVKYQTARNSNIRVYLTDGRRKFLQDDLLASNDQLSYDYQMIGTDTTWQITDKTAVMLGLDHTRRKGSVAQVSGQDVTAGFSWKPTSKLSFSGNFWISHPGVFNDDRNPNYERGIKLISGWALNEKNNLQFTTQRTNRTYDNFSGTNRYDTLTSYKLDWLYQFTNKISLDVAFVRSDRQSNLANYYFIDRTLSAQLQYQY